MDAHDGLRLYLQVQKYAQKFSPCCQCVRTGLMVSSDAPTAVDIQIYFYYALGSIVVLYYDYILTLPMEVERFWSRSPFSIGSVLFYLNRYLALLGHAPVFFQLFWTSDDPVQKAKICHPLSTFRQYFAGIVQIIVGIMLGMRTYALYSRSNRILVLLLTIATVVVATGAWGLVTSQDKIHLPDAAPGLGCTSSLTAKQGLHLTVPWIGLLVYDSMIFGLTLYKALHVFRAGRRSLVNILLRDGAVYFAVLAIMNLSNILTFVLAPPLLKGVCTTFTNVIATTLTSRLMLNLRDPANSISVTLPRRTLSTLRFGQAPAASRTSR